MLKAGMEKPVYYGHNENMIKILVLFSGES